MEKWFSQQFVFEPDCKLRSSVSGSMGGLSLLVGSNESNGGKHASQNGDNRYC